MQAFAPLHDKRIDAKNVILLMSMREYVNIAKDIIKKNVYQRDRVNKSNTVYSLLKSDLLTGCIIPPIILALNSTNCNAQELEYKIAACDINYSDLDKNKSHLLILDGFQRTNIILDIVNDLVRKGDSVTLDEFYNRELRVELYTGINRLGILYRMLTLNTGQTPMSLRHQIEMMYLDYLDIDFNGITLIKDTDDERQITLNKFKFSDAIDGFNSYLDRNELPIDRLDVLDNIKGLEKLSAESSKTDIFFKFIAVYNKIVNHFYIMSHDPDGGKWEFSRESSDLISGNPFGKDIVKIFSKSQALTGFGAATGKLIDLGKIADFDDIDRIIGDIKGIDDASLTLVLENLEKIRLKSKKIGNAQRMYFQYLFRELFNSDSDSYIDFSQAVSNAYQKYQSQVE